MSSSKGLRSAWWAAALLLAGLGLYATVARTELASAPSIELGTEALCQRYGGLPAGWQRDPRAGMVRIRGGEFTFGSERGYADERPAGNGHVRVGAFWIDETEVTVAQFASFVQATGYVTEAERQGGAVVFHQPSDAETQARAYAWWTFVKGADWRHPGGPGSSNQGQGHLPITFVTQADALAYARWLGRDLPTEVEWEYAGKAGRSGPELDTAPREASGRPSANYWQGVFPAFNAREDGHEGLAPVGCYAANAFGLHDMIGNVWEWTSDFWSTRHAEPAAKSCCIPHNPRGGEREASFDPREPEIRIPRRVLKGGSHLCAPNYCRRYRPAARHAEPEDTSTSHVGFRCVKRSEI